MATVIALWALTGNSMVPLMSAHECRDMMMAGMSSHHAATPHHQTKTVLSPNHECCKRKQQKPKPVKAEMPCCPELPGSMPRTCGMAELACCTLTAREESRRTAKTEKRKSNETPELALANELSSPSIAGFSERDRHLCDGLRYEKPVFDLKTDLRV